MKFVSFYELDNWVKLTIVGVIVCGAQFAVINKGFKNLSFPFRSFLFTAYHFLDLNLVAAKIIINPCPSPLSYVVANWILSREKLTEFQSQYLHSLYNLAKNAQLFGLTQWNFWIQFVKLENVLSVDIEIRPPSRGGTYTRAAEFLLLPLVSHLEKLHHRAIPIPLPSPLENELVRLDLFNLNPRQLMTLNNLSWEFVLDQFLAGCLRQA